MIQRETIDKIIDATRIEEVIGDFVHLKKRGTSLIGNCPFHNEKTPSFHVSVTKGIYKCFGCGAGGDSVRFVMDHEKYSYPEALKYLANKYQIEVEEQLPSPEVVEANKTRESLFVVTDYAAKFFSKQMWESNEGRAIGLSYFKERGFREDILKKFELGYAPEPWDALTAQAIQDGHQELFLEQSGLSIRNDKGKLYDRFRGRVIFPIHGFTGRIIGFGGRTLKTEKSVPKYVNSPESEIYHKSNVLYGLFQAKKSIRDLDNCYLAEGYADVLSIHQAGVENVVASSGTSLTVEQIRLIARFTKNITILYDGDEAGIKASLRSLDMILEEGLNVKVVSFPDKHDPDSYVHQVGAAAFKKFIEESKKDFILYKADVLLKSAGNDPIKRAEIIHDIVESIAKIPDQIKASIFVRECSKRLEIEERVLLAELNKLYAAKLKRQHTPKYNAPAEDMPPENLFEDHAEGTKHSLEEQINPSEVQEREIIRLLLNFGHELVKWDEVNASYVGSFMIQNLADVEIQDPICKEILEIYTKEIADGHLPMGTEFIKHAKRPIADLAVTLFASPYELSENWEKKHAIFVKDEKNNLRHTVMGGLYHLKKHKINQILTHLLKELSTEDDPLKQSEIMERYSQVKVVERSISDFLGAVIIK